MSFVDDCIAGLATPDDIYDYMESWSKDVMTDNTLSLIDYFGFNKGEYAQWIDNSGVLPDIIARRKAEMENRKLNREIKSNQ